MFNAHAVGNFNAVRADTYGGLKGGFNSLQGKLRLMLPSISSSNKANSSFPKRARCRFAAGSPGCGEPLRAVCHRPRRGRIFR